jgi:hypothetical protein
MADIFWDGFDKYGVPNVQFSCSTLTGEWTGLSSLTYGSLVAGRFAGSVALQLTNGATATRGLPANYPRLIGGVAIQSTLAGINGILFSDAGTYQCSISITTQGKIVLLQGNISNGTQIASTASVVTANSWHYLEWDLTFAASGAYTVWLDGAQLFTGTGNLKSSANAYANAVVLAGYVCNFDDMYLFDSTGSTNNAVRGDSRVETLFPAADASVSFTPVQGVLGGYYNLLGLSSSIAANILFLRRYIPSVGGTLANVCVLPQGSAASANFRPVVYADNAGSPGNLLTTGAQITGATAGATLVMPLTTAQTLTAGTAVWLGYMCDTQISMSRQDNSAVGYSASVTYSNGAPSTAPSMTSGQTSLQIWGTVTGIASNFSEVNLQQAGGDLSYVASSNVGQEDRYSFASLSSSPVNIAGVKVTALMRKSDSGARTVSMQLASGSTEVAGSAQAPATSYTYLNAYFDVDPNTGAAWTAGGVAGLTAGVKIAS